MRPPPALSMLFGAVVAGGGVGAISAAHYAGTTMADLAMIVTVAVSAFFSLGLGFVAIVGFAIGAAIAGKRADAAAGAAGLVGATLLGAAVLLARRPRVSPHPAPSSAT